MKLTIDELSPTDATEVARFLARVVGKAHARQMNEADRRAWLGVLRGRRSKTLDAPSWLWKSVIPLISSHEAAYLEHCRRFVLA